MRLTNMTGTVIGLAALGLLFQFRQAFAFAPVQSIPVTVAPSNATFTHTLVNLTGCGTNRSCGSMGAASMVVGGGLGVAFAGGSGIGNTSHAGYLQQQVGSVTGSRPRRGLPHPSTMADVVVLGHAAPSMQHLPDMPYPHADDVNDAAEVLGLTFFAGGGGAVSVWNSSAGQYPWAFLGLSV